MHYTVGLISDTHGVFDKAAADVLQHADLVIHAGDVGHHGKHREVLELYAAAGTPLLAVAGNVDDKLDAADRQLLPQHRLLQVAGWKLLACHIVAPGPAAKVDAAAAALVQQLQPDVVVCGHSHKACCWQAGGVAYINPGSAGPARFKLPRTVALLELPCKTPSAAAAAAGAPRDSKQRCNYSVSGRDEQPAPQAVMEPTTGIDVAAAFSKESASSDKGARFSTSTASKGDTASPEHYRAACVGSRMGYGRAASHASAASDVVGRQAAQSSSSSSCGTRDVWLGNCRLHVAFVQLPHKAPPRLKLS